MDSAYFSDNSRPNFGKAKNTKEIKIKSQVTKELIEYLQELPKIRAKVIDDEDILFLNTLEARLARVIKYPTMPELLQMKSDLISHEKDIKIDQLPTEVVQYLQNYQTCLNQIISVCQAIFDRHQTPEKKPVEKTGKLNRPGRLGPLPTTPLTSGRVRAQA